MPTVVIGDVHGCADELDELLARLSGGHRLVFAGDLVDRGPEPVRVVARVRELGAECVLGNHDEKHLRWARHAAKAAADPAYRHPMAPFPPVRAAEHAALVAAGAIAWFAELPVRIEVAPRVSVVHGGCVPKMPLRKQKPAVLLRCRFVDDAGAMIGKADPPPGAVHWATRWSGPETVIYGHHVHGLAEVRRDPFAIGIDTGCVFGGRLTAYVVETGEVVQVQARRAYAELRENQDGDA